jgi:hypothetical protein
MPWLNTVGITMIEADRWDGRVCELFTGLYGKFTESSQKVHGKYRIDQDYCDLISITPV